MQNLYINPQNSAKTADGSHLANVTDEEMQEHYDNFFEDVFVECEDKYGQVRTRFPLGLLLTITPTQKFKLTKLKPSGFKLLFSNLSHIPRLRR